MDAVALTVLVDRNGASSGEVFAARRADFHVDSAADFNDLRRLVVEPTMEAVVAVRTNAGCRMGQLQNPGETI